MYIYAKRRKILDRVNLISDKIFIIGFKVESTLTKSFKYIYLY